MDSLKAILALMLGLSTLHIGSQAYGQAQTPAAEKKGEASQNRAALDHLLTTTRTVRKRLDLTRPVDAKIIEEAIEIAVQAPTGSNAQGWHFVVVTDPDKKKAIADLYREGADMYTNRPRSEYSADDPRAKQRTQIAKSGAYLTLAVMMPVAYYKGTDFKPTKRLPAKEHTHWNTWGQHR